MPKASKTSAPENVELEGYEGHLAELDGYTVAFETYSADADMSPLFVGLPDDRCQCSHWHRSSGSPTKNGARSASAV